jgi:hypothetical protein
VNRGLGQNVDVGGSNGALWQAHKWSNAPGFCDSDLTREERLLILFEGFMWPVVRGEPGRLCVYPALFSLSR